MVEVTSLKSAFWFEPHASIASWGSGTGCQTYQVCLSLPLPHHLLLLSIPPLHSFSLPLLLLCLCLQVLLLCLCLQHLLFLLKLSRHCHRFCSSACESPLKTIVSYETFPLTFCRSKILNISEKCRITLRSAVTQCERSAHCRPCMNQISIRTITSHVYQMAAELFISVGFRVVLRYSSRPGPGV